MVIDERGECAEHRWIGDTCPQCDQRGLEREALELVERWAKGEGCRDCFALEEAAELLRKHGRTP